MRQRQWGMLLFTGIIGGILSGIVKLGWEVMFPPRTPERNATNPPQELLQQMGFSHDFTHQTYTFSHMDVGELYRSFQFFNCYRCNLLHVSEKVCSRRYGLRGCFRDSHLGVLPFDFNATDAHCSCTMESAFPRAFI